MASFETIAKPHSDILKRNFTLDTYAAKLGDVARGVGPFEYRNAKRFFDKTYETGGLKTLLSGVERRLGGRGGDPVVQLQTPFGGGKTHTLIALYHRAKAWNATPVVVVGSEMDPTDTFWAQLESQLTGEVERFKGHTAPGSTSVSDLFSQCQSSVMILMDEVLQYLTRAAGVSVQKGTLADQTLAFMLSLTEAVTSHKNVTLIATLQSSELEALVERFPYFNRVLGRMRRVITPVADDEIANIIRRRLFSEIDEKEAKRVAREFANYAKKESILPQGIQESEYRARFVESYPFQPEVIDVLYKRWGSFPEFQRTRGVLRLLSRVVACAANKNLPYITLADFDLSDDDIRGELLEHTGQEYRSILANDITGRNAGAKSVDETVGDTYKKFRLGTRTATAIFLYSFTGGLERGGTSDQIKRAATLMEVPAATIDTAINRLSEHLFYLRTEHGTSYFDTQPNLTRIVKTRMENVEEGKVSARAEAQLKKSVKPSSRVPVKTYIAPKNGSNIPETDELKLIVLSERDDAFCQNLLDMRGEISRVHRNTLFFLTPFSGTADNLRNEIRRVLAYEEIRKDNSLNLSADQKKEVAAKLKTSQSALDDALRRDYRTLLIPEKKEGFREEDLGLPAQGVRMSLDEAVYELLYVKGDILQSIGPRNIALRYLKDNETVLTSQLLSSSLRTPGETRVLREAWEEGIRQGVQAGLFGIGEKVDRKLIPRYFKDSPPEVTLGDGEVLIQPRLIRESITPQEILSEYLKDNETISVDVPFHYSPQSDNLPRPLWTAWESAIEEGVRERIFEIREKDGERVLSSRPSGDVPIIIDGPGSGYGLGPDEVPPRKAIQLAFTVPLGKVSNIAQHIDLLLSKFETVRIALTTTDGEISEQEYEQLKRDFSELGIEVEEG